MLLFIVLASPVPQLILLATGRAAHFPGDCTWETVAFSTSKTSEGEDSGQNGDLQNTLLNTIKFYVVLGGRKVRKKGEGYHTSMWNVLLYKRNMCVVNFVLHMSTQSLEMKSDDLMSQNACDTQVENREPRTSEQTHSGIHLHQIWNDQNSEVVLLGCLKKNCPEFPNVSFCFYMFVNFAKV